MTLMMFAVMQEAADSLAAPASGGGLPSAESLISIIRQAGGFEWPILGLFVLGMAVAARLALRVYMADRAAAPLKAIDIDSANTPDLRAAADIKGHSAYHAVIRGLMEVRDIGREHYGQYPVDRLPALLDEDATKQALGSTRQYIRYASEMCGGLGLIGTLVGMYAAFQTTGRDVDAMFTGITLALVSTLLGMVTSVILQTAGTLVDRYAFRHLGAVQAWGTAVCARMGTISKSTGDDSK